ACDNRHRPLRHEGPRAETRYISSRRAPDLVRCQTIHGLTCVESLTNLCRQLSAPVCPSPARATDHLRGWPGDYANRAEVRRARLALAGPLFAMTPRLPIVRSRSC